MPVITCRLDCGLLKLAIGVRVLCHSSIDLLYVWLILICVVSVCELVKKD